jgi:perosamine synthetase
MHHKKFTRRGFIRTGTTGAAAAGFAGKTFARPAAPKLAINGGAPVRTKAFQQWPQLFGKEEQRLAEVLHSGKWFLGGGKQNGIFEKQFAALMDSQYAIATASGTTALLTALEAVDVQPGDEVLVSSYTWVASATVILQKKAIPVFVDSDPDTFQMNPELIENKITDRTRAIIPVHHCGYPCDMDRIMTIARRHNIAVVEDAAQAHMALYGGKKIGSIGDIGCFSFQVSKCLPAGEGGACITENEELADFCYRYHSVCNHPTKPKKNGFSTMSTNFRLTEFQAVLLQEQLSGLEERAAHRHANVEYLNSLLEDVPGITPARLSPGCERGAYYNYQARYDAEQFKGLSRDKFINALQKEGVSCWGGWKVPLNREGFVEHSLQSRGFKRLYSPQYLDRYRANSHCPASDDICANTFQMKQNLFLGPKSDMDQIAEAIAKIQKAAASIS